MSRTQLRPKLFKFSMGAGPQHVDEDIPLGEPLDGVLCEPRDNDEDIFGDLSMCQRPIHSGSTFCRGHVDLDTHGG